MKSAHAILIYFPQQTLTLADIINLGMQEIFRYLTVPIQID